MVPRAVKNCGYNGTHSGCQVIDAMLRGAARLALQCPRRLVAAALVLAAIALYFSRHVSLDTDLTSLLPDSGTASGGLRDFIGNFGTGDRLLIALSIPESEPVDVDRLDAAGEALVGRLRKSGRFRDVRDRIDEDSLQRAMTLRLDHLPAFIEPQHLDELERRLSAQGIRDTVLDLRRRLLTPVSDLASQMAVADPLGLRSLLPVGSARPSGEFRLDLADGLFLSEDGRALLVVGEPIAPPFDVDFSRLLLKEVELALSELGIGGTSPPMQDPERRQFAPLRALVAGGYCVAVESEATMRRDMIVTATVSLSSVLLLFWLVFRQAWVPALLALPLGLSAAWTLGLTALLPGHLNAVTIGFAAILIGIGDDSAIHLCHRFAEESAAGRSLEEAIRACVQSTGRAILAANLTTATAFGLLLFTGFRVLSELSLLVLYGIAGILVAMLLVLPALLVIASRPRHPGAERRTWISFRVPNLGLSALSRRIMRTPGLWAAAPLVAAVPLAAFLPSLSFDMDTRRLRGAESEARRDERLLLDRFGGGSGTAYLVVHSATLDAALSAIAALRPSLERAMAGGEILSFDLPHPMLVPPARQKQMVEHLRRDRVFAGAAERLRLTLLESGFRVDPFEPALLRLQRWEAGEGLEMAFDGVRTRPPEWLTANRLRFEPDGVWLSIPVHLPASPDDAPFPPSVRKAAMANGIRIAYLPDVVREIHQVVVGDFRFFSVLVPASVVVLVWLLFHRRVTALAALLPMAYGVLAALGIAAALNIPIGMFTLIVPSVLFGLGADYGIFIMHRHFERGTMSPGEAQATAGRTVLITAATTFTGFASLCLARFQGLKEIGLLVACGIAAAVACALILLPALLALLERGHPPGAGLHHRGATGTDRQGREVLPTGLP